MKIITAAPVTDQRGKVVCGTTSKYNEWDHLDIDRAYTLSNINSNAEAYFGGSDIAGPVIASSTITSYHTISSSFDPIFSSTYIEDVISYTFTRVYTETYYQNHAGVSVTPVTQIGIVISLETPFVYVPLKGASGFERKSKTSHQTGETQSYGYVPRSLLDLLISDPVYSSQYPGLESCLPGGPSIISPPSCVQSTDPVATTMETVSDLTSSTIIYVIPPMLGGVPQSENLDAQSMEHKSGFDDKSDSLTLGIFTPTSRLIPISPLRETQAVTDPPKQSPTISSPTPTSTSFDITVSQIETGSPSPQSASKASLSQPPKTAPLGQIINSIFGGQPASPISPNSSSIVIPAATTIPIADIPFY